jgi:hypothetical protein
MRPDQLAVLTTLILRRLRHPAARTNRAPTGPPSTIADRVRDAEERAAAVLADCPPTSGTGSGEIWVNAGEARQWPPRRRFTIGHELGHWVMHRDGQQALFCRRTTVDEAGARPEHDIEEEASAFAAALLMPQWLFVREHTRTNGDVAALCATFHSSIAATERRIARLF